MNTIRLSLVSFSSFRHPFPVWSPSSEQTRFVCARPGPRLGDIHYFHSSLPSLPIAVMFTCIVGTAPVVVAAARRSSPACRAGSKLGSSFVRAAGLKKVRSLDAAFAAGNV